MKKLLLLLLLPLTVATSHAWDQRPPKPIDQCLIQSPYGIAATPQLTSICRDAYLVGYDNNAKIPSYVSYTLTPEHALGCVARTNSFSTDNSIAFSSTPKDYTGSKYDKGHMVPDGDLSWDQQIEYESFLMTNMSPQLPGFNRGIWKLLETSVRAWAEELNQPFTIYAGSLYLTNDKKIGSGVIVPHSFYKIVINNSTREVAGWLFPHAENLGNNLTKFRSPISHIESLANIKFSYPANFIELPTGKEWPVNYGQLTTDKQAVCKIK